LPQASKGERGGRGGGGGGGEGGGGTNNNDNYNLLQKNIQKNYKFYVLC
jgi:hypothetical protein